MTTTIPSASSVFIKLLRADMTTLWRNRRASLLVVLVPTVILITWKGLINQLGVAGVLSNCITVGLTAIGLMGYTNMIARDRDKGIFQRLRVAPAPKWTIMTSRLAVQLLMIVITTIVLFIVGYKFDGITIEARGYMFGLLAAIVGGAVYLSLGQIIVGLIKNPETVNVVTRLVYFLFIMIGTFGETGWLGPYVKNAVVWSPYGTVKDIISAALEPSTWNNHSSIALLITLGYTAVFATLGIRWFRWNTR
ncbi:MAG TPA: ABC transporter permease [Puia sp.]